MVASYCQLLQRRYKDKLEADANDSSATPSRAPSACSGSSTTC